MEIINVIAAGVWFLLFFLFVMFTGIMRVLVDIRKAVEAIHFILNQTPPSKGY